MLVVQNPKEEKTRRSDGEPLEHGSTQSKGERD